VELAAVKEKLYASRESEHAPDSEPQGEQHARRSPDQKEAGSQYSVSGTSLALASAFIYSKVLLYNAMQSSELAVDVRYCCWCS